MFNRNHASSYLVAIFHAGTSLYSNHFPSWHWEYLFICLLIVFVLNIIELKKIYMKFIIWSQYVFFIINIKNQWVDNYFM